MKNVSIFLLVSCFSISIKGQGISESTKNKKPKQIETEPSGKQETEKEEVKTISELIEVTINNELKSEYEQLIKGKDLSVAQKLEKIEELKEQDIEDSEKEFLNFLEEILSNKRFFTDKEEKKDVIMLKAPLEKELSLLHWAIEQDQNINAIKKLIAYELIPVDIKDEKGNTALHKAAGNGYLEIIEILCRAGALPNSKDNIEGTPLHNAAYAGHYEAVVILLSKGADPNLSTNKAETALHYATKEGHKDIVELLLDYHPKEPLKKADVNAVDEENMTALHYAATAGNIDITKMLLDHGANFRKKNYEEMTALKIAKERGNDEIVELLEEAEDKE